jgi:hypothetical protein
MTTDTPSLCDLTAGFHFLGKHWLVKDERAYPQCDSERNNELASPSCFLSHPNLLTNNNAAQLTGTPKRTNSDSFLKPRERDRIDRDQGRHPAFHPTNSTLPS